MKQLESLMEPIDSVHHHPRNPRIGHNVDQIAKSISELGWHAPIVATRSGEVIVGNGRLMAAHQLNLSHVPVLRVEDDDATAVRRMVTDNRLTDMSTWDHDALKALIDDFELQSMQYDLKLELDIEPPDFGEIDPGDATDLSDATQTCPACGHEFSKY